MSNITCRRLSFGYPGSEDNIFEDLDLAIDTHWRCALVGRNGRGKTTLLRLIHGELTPDGGRIECAKPTAYFPRPVIAREQRVRDVVKDTIGPFRRWEAEMNNLLTDGSEDALDRYGEILEAYEQTGGYVVGASIEAKLSALDIDEQSWDRPFSSLSGGQQTRCLLASLFVADGSSSTAGSSHKTGSRAFALIDEPTNHLDAQGRRLLADYLSAKAGFLLASHDRAFLDACCDHVVALNRDTIEVERTSFSSWRQRYRQRLARQRAENAALKQGIERLTRVAADRRAGALKRESDKAAHVDKGFISNRAKRQMKRALAAECRAENAADARRRTLVDVEKDTLQGSARTYLVHTFGSGLDGEDHFVVERFKALVDGDIRPIRPEAAGGKHMVVSREAAEAMRPARTEIIICTGLRTRGGRQLYGDIATGIFHDRRQRG